MTPQETDPDLPMSVQESPVEAWVSGGLPQGGGTECSSTSWDLLKEVTWFLKGVAIIFLTSTIVWPQVKQQGGNTAPSSNRKLD